MTDTAPARDVRAWAHATGRSVGSRGRFPTEVVDAYNAAHPDRPYLEGRPA